MAKEFSVNVTKWANETRSNLPKVTKWIASKLQTKVVMRTPVDTGRASASWNIVAGRTVDGSTAPEDFFDPTGGKAISLARLESLPDALVYTISNSVPYIIELETQRKSRQAPNGMMIISLVELEAELESRRRV